MVEARPAGSRYGVAMYPRLPDILLRSPTGGIVAAVEVEGRHFTDPQDLHDQATAYVEDTYPPAPFFAVLTPRRLTIWRTGGGAIPARPDLDRDITAAFAPLLEDTSYAGEPASSSLEPVAFHFLGMLADGLVADHALVADLDRIGLLRELRRGSLTFGSLLAGAAGW